MVLLKKVLPAKRFLPVIHCVCPYDHQGVDHAVYNAHVAYDNGADGVFLIGHGLRYFSMCDLYEQVRKQFPEGWIGINLLDVVADANWRGLEILTKRCLGLNALWIDSMPDTRLNIDSSIEVFGGVAFKHQKENQRGAELAAACNEAIQRVDVVTTSGSQTGSPPDIAKLEEIRGYIGKSQRLALASGVTEENSSGFLLIVDDILAASSVIERDPNRGGYEYFIPERIKRLASIIEKVKV